MSMYFILFSILTIISSLMIISSKNSITSVLYLISVYVLASLMLLLLGAEFLAVLIVIVYIGAISILFLFVIMMLNLRIVEVYNTLVSYFPIGSFLGVFFFFTFLFLLNNDLNFFSLMYTTNNSLKLDLYSNDLVFSYNNLQLLGDILYNKYSYFLI
jgi:NADH-quinone oxidoreductase subunit J